ncbi:MAG: SDR family NAD(P)-dependent oxidoreductase, partial [Vicinamibacterales bacterium]
MTGGSRGIGRGIAELLAERGAAVGVAYRDRAEPALELVAAIQKQGGRAGAGQCDVRDETAVKQFFGQIERELGPPDILV